jgi:16S rRNA (adenine1518-N6/adenine1519-N6)-dimethyltransferase
MTLPGEKAQLQLLDDKAFLDFVKTCFAQKRKTLVNNLRGSLLPSQLKAALAELRLAEAARAEELAVSQLADLYLRLQTPA